MQTTVSTCPAVMDAVVDLLNTLKDTVGNALHDDSVNPTGHPVQVSYGHPGDDSERETLWIANVQFGDDKEAGTRSRDETYDIDLFFDVHRPELNSQEAMERAWAVLSAIQLALHNRPMPAGVPDGVHVLELRPRFARMGFDPDGQRWTDAYAVVHVEARK